MKTPETITTMLYRQADRRAELDVEEAMAKVWALFMPFKDAAEAGYYSPEKKWIGADWTALKANFIEVLTPHYRERELRDFVNKVESLAGELDALRDQIPQ
jgi:hypothetical protein